MTQRCILLSIIIHWILFMCHIEIISSTDNSRLLIISLDGFRHDYLKKHVLRTLNQIQNEGIKTKHGMEPTFVTMTMPNHVSIATGMYQEDHGIIHNRFNDTKLKKFITFNTKDIGQWTDYNVEPIWITATKQNKKSAVLYWPTSHNEFNGIRPSYYTSKYSDSVPLREKIDDAITFFRNSSFQLVMLYHFEPDRQGHDYGPNSNEVRKVLLRLDNELAHLLKRVKKELNDDLNIIILSDHGMEETKQLIQPFLDGYIDKSAVEDNILDGPLFSVTPRLGYFKQVFDNLTRIPHVTVYKRDEFPERYHYAKAIHRIGEIIVMPNNVNTFFSQKTVVANVSKGNHGYDNKLPSMQAIFMARGPDFQQHIEIDSLKNVDVYHIGCKILNLKPNPYATAGSLNNLTHIFRKRTNKCSQLFIDMSVVLFVLFLDFAF
ncbi:unnamed protein product [Adineta steineri]|uniref:Uncharacterized protein n=1 Tax=Adineta steineri TaxID=433720 RepID=A0A814GVH7_9BILA|nr:unnamed protein product [Adineta steineri]CAF3481068.1 unnamed protein product [Adineta steineri]CAF3795364.1 unnamed protein product [Adineta steineri]